jgi:hypothetical protein
MLTLGENSRLLLGAVAAGRVQAAPVANRALNRYLLDGVESVDVPLASLLREDLIYLPRLGPPRLTPDGEWALTNFC